MKNSELYSLQQGLAAVKNLKGLKFAIMVAKNTKAVSEEIQTINDNQLSSQPEVSKEFIAYDKARAELAEEHADRDDNDKAVVVDNKFVMTYRQVEFDEAWKVLRDEHSDTIDARNESMKEFQKEFQELMDTESEVTLVTVSEDRLPEEITADQILAILPLIED